MTVLGRLALGVLFAASTVAGYVAVRDLRTPDEPRFWRPTCIGWHCWEVEP